jgi:CheY-like chemotaxis protein
MDAAASEGGAMDGLREGLRVLVVDDDHDHADSCGFLVRKLGGDVRLAYDGLAALDIAKSFQPELALLDLGMPKVDGLTVARLFRATPGVLDARLVALTGFADFARRERAYSAGFDEFVVKPYSIELLRHLLEQTRLIRAHSQAIREQSEVLRAEAIDRRAMGSIYERSRQGIERGNQLRRRFPDLGS